jgi:hypothetical protein
MIIFLFIFIAIIILGAYLKNDYQIVREINISKSKSEVFSYIKLLKNQNEYSYYNRKDPKTIKSYTGTDGEVGFTYSWSSKISSIGTGTQTISKIVQGEEIWCDIQFTKPASLKSIAIIALTRINENETKVIWTFSSFYKPPFNVIVYFLNLEKLIGKDIASSLVNLKENLEK